MHIYMIVWCNVSFISFPCRRSLCYLSAVVANDVSYTSYLPRVAKRINLANLGQEWSPDQVTMSILGRPLMPLCCLSPSGCDQWSTIRLVAKSTVSSLISAHSIQFAPARPGQSSSQTSTPTTIQTNQWLWKFAQFNNIHSILQARSSYVDDPNSRANGESSIICIFRNNQFH